MSAILKNCTCIDEKSLDIIEFWFGGDQQINYRTKWFPEGSSEQQAAIDLEIFTKYGSLLESALRRELMSWQKYRTSCIALIILLDQFSRHIYRHLGEPSPSPKRQETDSLALEVAKFLHSSSSEVILDLPMAEYVFSLMPLRHNQTIDHLQFILSKLTEKEDSSVKANELLQRFRKQTTRRLQHLQDRQRLEATDEILERHPFQADETNILKDRLVSTTEAFLKRTLPSAPYTSSISPPQVTDTNTQKKIIKNIVMISLSGGVDSMVICKILALLRDSKKVAIDNIVAIHIDYANRPESGREAAYVQQWSESLNVHCRVRVVNEVTRGITDRDVYEKVSRNIRYTFYQDCIQAALRGEFDSSEKTIDGAEVEVEYRVSGILFGHHLGDVQENVISNVMRGCSPLDLSGMTETSVTNNVHVWRPLLSHVKDDIYSFAHQYGVPYFKDSTPSWSTRGKLRNQLVPLLIEIYGEGCLRNLSNLAMESDNTQELVYNNLYKPFFDSVRRSQCGLMVNILPYRHQPLCFWKEVLKQLMHSMSMSMIRDKAVGNFVERLQRVTLQQLQKQQKSSSTAAPQLLPAGWLELRKGYHTYLNEANDLIVLRDGTLRKNLVVYNPATTKNQMMQSSGSSQKNKEKKKSSSATEEKKTENPVAVVPKTSSPVGSLKDTIIALSCPDNLLVLTNEVSGIAHILDSSDSVAGISVGVTSLALNNTIQYNVHYDEGRFAALGKEDYEDSNPAEEVECEERGANAVRSNTVPNEDNSIHSKILNFGPWKISITFNRILTTSSTNPLPRKTKLLKNVEDLLSESFSYKIYWPCHSPAGSPVQCDFIFLKDFLNLFEQFIVERRSVGGGAEYYSLAQHFYHEETTLFPDIINALSFDLKSMELRLRDGLPILIPAFVQQTVKDGGAEKFISSYHGVGGSEEEGKKKESSEYFIEFELSYEYINK